MRVILKDGTVYNTRFLEQNRKFCIVDAGRFPWKNVEKFYILKERT